MTITAGTLLGGRVRYQQLAEGHRTGIEPVLLAAAVPAASGDLVLEAGTGAGAGLLCLSARVPGVRGVGVEVLPRLAALAADNFRDNGAACLAVAADITRVPLAAGGFDHGFANPPWHDAAGTPSPSAAQDLARRGRPALLRGWARALCGLVRPGGSVTLILPAAQAPEALAALAAEGCGALVLYPLWPVAGRAARLALVRGLKGRRTPAAIVAGMVLHAAEGGFTPAAESVLRDGAAIDLAAKD